MERAYGNDSPDAEGTSRKVGGFDHWAEAAESHMGYPSTTYQTPRSLIVEDGYEDRRLTMVLHRFTEVSIIGEQVT